MIWTCAVLDLLDGLAARALNVSSDLGKQLDSLSDLVAFGLLPATIIYALSEQYFNRDMALHRVFNNCFLLTTSGPI